MCFPFCLDRSQSFLRKISSNFVLHPIYFHIETCLILSAQIVSSRHTFCHHYRESDFLHFIWNFSYSKERPGHELKETDLSWMFPRQELGFDWRVTWKWLIGDELSLMRFGRKKTLCIQSRWWKTNQAFRSHNAMCQPEPPPTKERGDGPGCGSWSWLQLKMSRNVITFVTFYKSRIHSVCNAVF